MLWDLFCRVVDNFGDAGVCWRLARDLTARGERVRLWIDDASPLTWMAPQGTGAVEIVPWTEAPPAHTPGDVVIEAFGCDPPNSFVRRMARASDAGARNGSGARARAPVWINLEYLSAEDYVGRSHGLMSPQMIGPGAGLNKWFYYPGFDASTGGLIRERDLIRRRRAFDKRAWMAGNRIERRSGERVVSLFCYPNPQLPCLLNALSQQPTLLLVAPGQASAQVGQELGARGTLGGLRAVSLPFLAQDEFDHLLWSCDLNFVRGEDSLVRAQWAGRPFVWQAYPQHDAAHDAKLEAFMARLLAGARDDLADAVRSLHRRWNGGAGEFVLPPLPTWGEAVGTWREQLLGQPDLVTALTHFVRERQ